jgi:hypothetical protein
VGVGAVVQTSPRYKQAEGWWLERPGPGVLSWRTPSGRTHTSTPAVYPGVTALRAMAARLEGNRVTLSSPNRRRAAALRWPASRSWGGAADGRTARPGSGGR